ncbi:type II secretion system minor pseudopilin GspI [Pelomonas sp. KK5]|uniref:type II secretion system minor pseudopilin GspI n=1 Tax=Pelomonas sp. KK5 TaxID=1855730 RepID=UPI003511AD24
MMTRRSQGFTLLEVMVALVIVAVALAAGMKAAGALTDNAARLRDVTVAQWCAQNQLTELRLNHTFPGSGESTFSCEQLGRSYQGRQVVRSTPNPNFQAVDVIVSDEQGRQQLTLSTIVGRY